MLNFTPISAVSAKETQAQGRDQGEQVIIWPATGSGFGGGGPTRTARGRCGNADRLHWTPHRNSHAKIASARPIQPVVLLTHQRRTSAGLVLVTISRS
ncbi:hypothetical protein [Allokutzneria oryzae]|uniref:Uncharacterized protein n=1 Tax=Allokutzneria oryzae TaxID=1378989 RepID=A0ABV6A4U3_9PSEU